MGRVYFPDKDTITCISAEKTHGPGMEYVVSSGIENWNGVEKRVHKVQMSYNGFIQGRKCPSYPTDSDDLLLVMEALKKLG